MNVNELLRECVANGVRLAVEDAQLRVQYDDQRPSAELLARLQRHKALLIRSLSASDSGHNADSGGLLPLNRSTSTERLFCIHPLGGSVADYVPLARALEAQVAVYGIPSPDVYGHEDEGSDGVQGFAALTDYSRHYRDRILALQAEGPHHLLGWSLGGELAYELGCLLAEAGQAPGFVGLVDSFPNTPVRRQANRELGWADVLRAMLGASVEIDWQEVGELPQPEGVARVERAIIEQGRKPAGVDDDRVGNYLRHLCRIIALRPDYIPTRSHLELSVFQARDTRVTVGETDERAGDQWGRYTSGPVQIFEVAGAHHSVLSAEHLPSLLSPLTEQLGRWLQSAGDGGGSHE